jgi:hypothetical protein
LEFSSLSNPVLDQERFETSLGSEEVEFYLQHVRSHLPKELEAMRRLAEAIREGKRTAASLDPVLKGLNTSWSDQTVSTQKAGLLGRMLELGLLEIVWSGPNSSYRCTEKGEKMLLGLEVGSTQDKNDSDRGKSSGVTRRRS